MMLFYITLYHHVIYILCSCPRQTRETNPLKYCLALLKMNNAEMRQRVSWPYIHCLYGSVFRGLIYIVFMAACFVALCTLSLWGYRIRNKIGGGCKAYHCRKTSSLQCSRLSLQCSRLSLCYSAPLGGSIICTAVHDHVILLCILYVLTLVRIIKCNWPLVRDYAWKVFDQLSVSCLWCLYVHFFD